MNGNWTLLFVASGDVDPLRREDQSGTEVSSGQWPTEVVACLHTARSDEVAHCQEGLFLRTPLWSTAGLCILIAVRRDLIAQVTVDKCQGSVCQTTSPPSPPHVVVFSLAPAACCSDLPLLMAACSSVSVVAWLHFNECADQNTGPTGPPT